MTRAELLDLFTPIYDEFRKMKFEEFPKVHPQFFDVMDDPTKDFKFNAISGFGAWDEVTEDSEEGLDHLVIGYEGTATQVKYRKFYFLSFQANDQMEYAELKKAKGQIGDLASGGAARAEIETAKVLYNGFTNRGADNDFLWGNSHPKNPEETGILYDNLLSGGFSHDNLELAETQISANYFDMDGIPIPMIGKIYIVHAPAIRGVVNRVLSERADKRPGDLGGRSPEEINLYAGKYISVEWPYLSAALGGSDTAWYIINPAMAMLKMIWSMRPQFNSWIDNPRHRYYFDAWELFKAVATDWRCGFASTGL